MAHFLPDFAGILTDETVGVSAAPVHEFETHSLVPAPPDTDRVLRERAAQGGGLDPGGLGPIVVGGDHAAVLRCIRTTFLGRRTHVLCTLYCVVGGVTSGHSEVSGIASIEHKVPRQDLPDVGMDAFSTGLDRMVTLLNQHLPA